MPSLWKMITNTDKVISKSKTLWNIATFAIIFFGGSVTAITAHLSSYFKNKDLFFFFMIGLITALICSLILLFISLSRKASAHSTYLSVFTSVKEPKTNPLKTYFENEIIRLSDLELPLNAAHERKTFKGCDIVGPGVVVITGGGRFDRSSFLNCGDVIFIPERTQLSGVIPLVGCNVLDCRFINLTVITNNTPEALSAFSDMGARCLIANFR